MQPVPESAESQLSYPHVLEAVLEAPWAITPDGMAVVAGIVARRIVGGDPVADSMLPSEPRAPGAYRIGPVGVLPLYGAIFPRANLMTEHSGATSLQLWMAQARRLYADQDVGAVVLDVDSPGGSVYGLAEAAAELHALAAAKPTVAVSNYLCGSAAYMLACQAQEIVASPSSVTGSIGTLMVHESLARALEAEGKDLTTITAGLYKAEGVPWMPLSEEAQAAYQRMVDVYYGQFVDAVARGRNLRSSQVRGGLGQGRALIAPDALAEGLVDRIDTLDAVVERLQVRGGRKRGRPRAEVGDVGIAAQVEPPEQSQPRMSADELADQVMAALKE